MADQQIAVLRLTVGSDGKIRIGERPPGFTAANESVRFDHQVDPLAAKTIEVLIDMARHNRLREEDEYRLLGEHLYSVLLDNQIGRDLNRALYNPDLKLVRVLLEFEGDHPLAAWPWEYLYSPVRQNVGGTGYFLGQLTKLVLIRHLPTGFDRQVTVDKPPVNVLFVASRPKGMSLSYQSVKETLEQIAEREGQAMNLQVIEPETYDDDSGLRLASATYRKVIDTAAGVEPHIIHIVAHGRRLRAGGQLAFMDASGGVDWRDEKQIAQDLSSMNLPSLRLVFLEACESALPDTDSLREHYAAISGVAMRLAHVGIPAVVGMQYQIEQGSSNVFTRAFYTALLERETVDIAVLHGRRELVKAEADRQPDENGDDSVRQSRPGFGLPVVYLCEPAALFPPPGEDDGAGGQGEQTPPGPLPPPSPAAARALVVPTPPAECPRCGWPCDPTDKYCDRCLNYLKCPKCMWPLLRARTRCGNCSTPLAIPRVELNPKRGVRAPPPAAGEAGTWG